MQTMQVMISSFRAIYWQERVELDEASSCEYSFKNTAYNSAATFLVCICKTDSHIIC